MSEQTPPNYPVSSGAAANRTSGSRVDAPSQVAIAFWLYIAAAAVSLIVLIVAIASMSASKAALESQLSKQGSRFSDSQLNAVIGTSVAVAVIFGILFLAAYVFFAVMMRRGANWARILLLILTVLSLSGVAGAYGLGAARVILSIIATILIFLRPANEYFRAVKANKLAAR